MIYACDACKYLFASDEETNQMFVCDNVVKVDNIRSNEYNIGSD